MARGELHFTTVKALADNPQDQEAAIRPMFEAAGGKVLNFYFGLGESDWFVVSELPDNTAAVAVAMAVALSPSLTNVKTTALLTPAEAMESMKQAKTLAFRPATG